MAVLLFALNGSAQEAACYRHTDCGPAELCLDQVCAVPVQALPACETDGDCEGSEVCDAGYCKVSGVVCQNDYGSCHNEGSSGGCECLSGDASEWASGAASDEDGEPVEPPTPSDADLYIECLTMVEWDCEPPPDPAETCSEEELSLCTEVTAKYALLEENCETFWDAYWEDDDVGVSTGTAQAEPPPPAIDADGGVPDDVTVAAQEMDPWEIADCCEELQRFSDEEPEFEEMLDCILALADDDCEGALACEESVYYGVPHEGGESMTASDGKDDAADEENAAGAPTDPVPAEEPADTTGENAGGDTTTASQPDTTTDEGVSDAPPETPQEKADDSDADSDDDGGCSFVPKAQSKRPLTLLNLLVGNLF
jgi:hypothetical protein